MSGVAEYTEWEYGKNPEDDDEWNAVPVSSGGTFPRGALRCRVSHESHSGGDYYCTRPVYHPGDHVAFGAHIVARWPNENEQSHGRYTRDTTDYDTDTLYKALKDDYSAVDESANDVKLPTICLRCSEGDHACPNKQCGCDCCALFH